MDKLREIDARVAKTIFGLDPCDMWDYVNFGSAGGPCMWKQRECEHATDKCYPQAQGEGENEQYGPPHYTTKMEAAWNLVEKLQSHGYTLNLQSVRDKQCSEFLWECFFQVATQYTPEIARELTPSMAIVVAAMRTVRERA